MMLPVSSKPLNSDQIKTAFKVVLNIFVKYKSTPETATFSPDLIERISYLLNIHAALRILFSNPESVYQWIRKPNKAPFYNGRSAMEIMMQGRVVDLWSVASRLNAERGGKA